MFKFKLILPLIFVILYIWTSGCSQNEDQREFENEAFSLPQGITHTNNRGEIINGNSDPDDWRVSPFYQGLVFVDPAYPNPVLTNQQLSLQIHLPFIDTISTLFAYVMRDAIHYNFIKSETALTLTVFIFDPVNEIARFSENPQGLYRIVIVDDNDNVVTYGDVKIE